MKLFYNHLLAPHTTWKVGGPADIFFVPANINELSHFLADLNPSTPLIFLGNGSNVLIPDDGIKGAVICLHNTLNQVSRRESTVCCPKQNTAVHITAQAGASLTKLAFFTAKNNLTGLEFLAGIPGLLGGGLAMNAGAHGDSIWNHIVNVDMIDRHGKIKTRQKDEFQIDYRHVVIPKEEWFIGATLQLKKGDAKKSNALIKTYLQQREKKQPLSLPNAGSVFKNPPNDVAARLIETAGLKDYRIGGAVISKKHANFIVNDQNATAKDIEKLIEHIEKIVFQTYNIRLETEIHKMRKNSETFI